MLVCSTGNIGLFTFLLTLLAFLCVARFLPLHEGYGQTGPYALRSGYDVMIEAEAGLMYITGEEDGPPVNVGVAVTGKHPLILVTASLL